MDAERTLFRAVVHVELDVLEVHDRTPDRWRLCRRLAAVRLETRFAPEERRRLLQVLLPEQRLHEDIERLVLDGELVYVIVIRSVVVHRPTRGGEHEISRGPFIAIARDSRITLAVEIVVDRRGNMAVGSVHDLRRANRHGGEEIRRDAVRSARDGVVHHVEPAPGVLFPERLELVELAFYFLPGEVQRLRHYRFRIDEDLVRHQHAAVRADADHPVGTLAAWIAKSLSLRRVLHRVQLGGRLVLGKIDLHVLKEGHVRIGEAHLKILAVVDVTVDCVGRMVPHVESLESDALPRDQRMAGTTNAEIDLGGVVAERRRLLARLQDRESDLDARREARRIGLGERMHDQRLAPAVRRPRQAREAFGFGIDLAPGDYDRRPVQVLVLRALTGAVGEATLHLSKILLELVHKTLLGRGTDRTP